MLIDSWTKKKIREEGMLLTTNVSPVHHFTEVFEKPTELWVQTGRVYVCHAPWIKRGQFGSEWEVKHLLVQAIRCLAKAGISPSYLQKHSLQSACVSLTFSFYELSSIFICLHLQSELEIFLFVLSQCKHWLQLSILPRVSKCLQWVITHCIGWLFRWITCIK